MRHISHLPLDSIFILLVLLAIPTPQNVRAKTLDPVELSFNDDSQPACNQTEVHEYFKCIENYNEKLKKREAITIQDLEACTATRKNCLIKCKSQSKRTACDIEKCPLCPTVKLTEGQKRIIVEGQNHTYKYEMPILAGQNITTIIKLTNIINNTNIVDIPTHINSTNINNLYLFNNETSETGGDYGLGYTKDGSCCLAVQPKTCMGTSNGMRCHHKRHKTCGSQCTSRTIHVQLRKRCTRSTGCQQRIGYVPQPQHPQCVYTNQWPHVSCGGKYQQNCDGCYDHYGYGADKYYSDGSYPQHCNGCYDNAFDVGPRYRRAPVFRQFYYHQAPCHLYGTCGIPICNPYGCYGNEYVDPAFGYWPPYYNGPNNDYGAAVNTFYDDGLEFTNVIGRSEMNDTKSTATTDETKEPWGVQMYKCKVVGDDGSIQVRNCTRPELESNPFAASPYEYPYYSPQPYESPDYMSDQYFNAPRTARWTIGHHLSNPRGDSIYDDYVNDEEDIERPHWQAHRKKHTSNTERPRRKVQIIHDEDDGMGQE